MERTELIEWAIKGLEKEMVILDSKIYNDKHTLKLIEEGEYSRANKFKTYERLMSNIEEKGQIERKLFDLKFERDLNENT